MICRRCDQPIRPGEDYTSLDKISNSAGGITVHWHKECPPPQGSATGATLLSPR